MTWAFVPKDSSVQQPAKQDSGKAAADKIDLAKLENLVSIMEKKMGNVEDVEQLPNELYVSYVNSMLLWSIHKRLLVDLPTVGQGNAKRAKLEPKTEVKPDVSEIAYKDINEQDLMEGLLYDAIKVILEEEYVLKRKQQIS